MLKRLFSLFNSYFQKTKLEIYTDGSVKQGRGSWAFMYVQNGKVLKEEFGSVKKTTSLRMELQAAIEALKSIPRNSIATLYCDSRIVVDAMKQKKSPLESRPNYDLQKSLYNLNKERAINWKWIKAHSGNEFNEHCDKLCVLARDN